jgi:hypothetical protein
MKNSKEILAKVPPPRKRNPEDYMTPRRTYKGLIYIRQYKCPHCGLPIYSDQKFKAGVWGEIHRYGPLPAYQKATVHKECVEEYQANFIDELFIDYRALDNFIELLTRFNKTKSMDKQILELSEQNAILVKKVEKLSRK